MRSDFGRLADGTAIDCYTLTNSSGLSATILTYGATLQSLTVPDRDGRPVNVVLGFDSLDGYTSDAYRAAVPYFGGIIGRHAGRIAEGRFVVAEQLCRLPINDPPNNCHSGPRGFDTRVWTAEPLEVSSGTGVCLGYTAQDGEQGFPGALDVSVHYTLDDRDRLRIDYRATTDAPTIVNLTSHAYWNLAGEASGSVHGHLLRIPARRYTPLGPTLVPTGRIEPVSGTPFDFTRAAAIGARLGEPHPQLQIAGGYDHNFVLDRPSYSTGLHEAARLHEPVSGRRLTISTTLPGLQIYPANHLDGTLVGSGGRAYLAGDGVALETQHFPDAPNQPDFPSTLLWPGQIYATSTVYAFVTAD